MTPNGQQAGKKILIIEDEKPLSHALQLKLSHEGYQTVVATDGEEGLAQVKSEKFDIILMDIIMPKMDGFTLLQKIKDEGINTASEVIVLSNLGQDEDITRAREIGIRDYLVKSNTPISQIVETVNTILS